MREKEWWWWKDEKEEGIVKVTEVGRFRMMLDKVRNRRGRECRKVLGRDG